MDIVKLGDASCATIGVCAECGISSMEDTNMYRIIFINGSICLCSRDFEEMKRKWLFIRMCGIDNRPKAA